MNDYFLDAEAQLAAPQVSSWEPPFALRTSLDMTTFGDLSARAHENFDLARCLFISRAVHMRRCSLFTTNGLVASFDSIPSFSLLCLAYCSNDVHYTILHL